LVATFALDRAMLRHRGHGHPDRTATLCQADDMEPTDPQTKSVKPGARPTFGDDLESDLAAAKRALDLDLWAAYQLGKVIDDDRLTQMEQDVTRAYAHPGRELALFELLLALVQPPTEPIAEPAPTREMALAAARARLREDIAVAQERGQKIEDAWFRRRASDLAWARAHAGDEDPFLRELVAGIEYPVVKASQPPPTPEPPTTGRSPRRT
jgi:hypothetical protein